MSTRLITCAKRQLRRSLTALIAALLAPIALGQADGILDDVQIYNGDDGGTLIEISFTCPISYRGHSPQEEGTEVRVTLVPVRCNLETEAPFVSDLRPPQNASMASLRELIFEWDTLGGPTVTLYFDQAVRFGVRQGRDSRSLAVTVNAGAGGG